MFVCEDCLPKQMNAMPEPAVVAPLGKASDCICICENAKATFAVVLVSDIFNEATKDEWGVKCHYLSTFNLAFKTLSIEHMFDQSNAFRKGE